jgi:hypothetical protein
MESGKNRTRDSKISLSQLGQLEIGLDARGDGLCKPCSARKYPSICGLEIPIDQDEILEGLK